MIRPTLRLIFGFLWLAWPGVETFAQTATAQLSPFSGFANAVSQNTRAITASTTKAGAVFRAPKTGNIRYIGTTYTALSGSPTLDLRIETVSSGLPTGTLFGTNTNVALSPGAADTFAWTQLTADAAVTAGDFFAAVVGYTSGTSATCASNLSFGGTYAGMPYPVVMASGSWATSQGWTTVCVKYDDGTLIYGQFPIASKTSSNIQSGTNPNERASVWVAPFNATLTGVRFQSNLGTTAAYSVNLYSGTSTTPAATITVASSPGGLGNAIVSLDFASPVTLTSGATYRLSILATAAVNVGVHRFLFLSTAERDSCVGEIWSDTRNGSSWIGASTTTTELIFPRFGTVTTSTGSPSIKQGRVLQP